MTHKVKRVLALRTGEPLGVRVADAVLALDGGDELVDEGVELPGVRPRLALQVLQQLLVRRVELHPGRQPHPVLTCMHRQFVTQTKTLIKINNTSTTKPNKVAPDRTCL